MSASIMNYETILDSAAFLQASLNKLLNINFTMYQMTIIPQLQCHHLQRLKFSTDKWFHWLRSLTQLPIGNTPTVNANGFLMPHHHLALQVPSTSLLRHIGTNFFLVTLSALITLQAINFTTQLLLHIMPRFLIVNTTYDNGFTINSPESSQHHSGPFFHFLCVNLFTSICTDIALLS